MMIKMKKMKKNKYIIYNMGTVSSNDIMIEQKHIVFDNEWTTKKRYKKNIIQVILIRMILI